MNQTRYEKKARADIKARLLADMKSIDDYHATQLQLWEKKWKHFSTLERMKAKILAFIGRI